MKKTIQTEVTICDNCKEQSYCESCLSCGVDHCWRCRDKCGHEYKQGLYISGSGDGYYCNACDAKMALSDDKRYAAYRKIHELREESKAWNEDFEKRRRQAEEELAQLPAF